MKELIKIQNELKAPKSQRNTFGNYNYRSLEDIQEALKPLLNEHKCFVTVSDEIILIGDRFYVKATATIQSENGAKVSNTAYAREPLDKKGMDASQITGATSSYARKYALNGLFAIDDTKDADATNTHGSEKKDHKGEEPTHKTPSKMTGEEAAAAKIGFEKICENILSGTGKTATDFLEYGGAIEPKAKMTAMMKWLRTEPSILTEQLQNYKYYLAGE